LTKRTERKQEKEGEKPKKKEGEEFYFIFKF